MVEIKGIIFDDVSTASQELTCRHHWIIQTPTGATSWGQCKFCNGRREFANFLDFTHDGSDRSLPVQTMGLDRLYYLVRKSLPKETGYQEDFDG